MARKKSLQPGENETLRRELRLWLETTRRQQSDVAREIGISQQSISSFLKGTTGVSHASAEKLATLLGSTLAELLAQPSPAEPRARLRIASSGDPSIAERNDNKEAREAAQAMARSVLVQIADGRSVVAQDLYKLASAALRLTPMTRLALHVLTAEEDEPIPYRRMVQLAGLVAEEVRRLEDAEPRPSLVRSKPSENESG